MRSMRLPRLCLTACVLVSLLAVLVLFTSPARGDGLIIVPEPHPHPRPHPLPRPEHHRFAPLHVKKHHVDVEINGQVAETSVDQVFYNPTNRRLEGTYIFPLPKGAQIDNFTMDIGGKQVEAELLSADKARKIYEDIVRRMKDPALLEYVGRGAFKVRIFPIEPHGNKHVTLKYTQMLEADSELVTYTYPLNTEKFSAKPIESVSLRCRIRTDHPLKTIYSPTHEVETTRHGPKEVVVGFESRNVKPDTDFQLVYSAPPAPEHGIAMHLLTHRAPGEEDGYYMLMAAPGTDLTDEQITAKDVIFVMDTSGSMSGEKLAQAQKALRFCVRNLNEKDRFEIVRFSTEAEPLFGKLADADDKNRKQAQRFIDDFKAVGGTAIDEALDNAVDLVKERGEKADRPAMVVFLTDGRPTIGENDPDKIVKGVGEAGGARVFSFGVGTDINTHLLDNISENTGALTQYVLPDEDIEIKLSSFYGKIAHPVLTDVKLHVDGGPRLSKQSPSTLGDIFRGQQLVQFGRYSGDGDAAITLSGKLRGKQVELVRELSFPKRAKKHDFIPRLWATRRVGYLLDQIRLHGESDELREEVVRLARHYGIVTPYTSYLIMEDEQRREVPAMSRTMEGRARGDGPVLAEGDAADAYQRLKSEESGDLAVSGAKSSRTLRDAEQLNAPQEAANEAAGGFGGQSGQRQGQPTGELRGDTDASAHAQQFVAGRSFYRRGDQWIDATVQSHPDAERVEVEIGSDAYFALLSKHEDAAQWLSVGREVQLLLDGKVYVVR